MGCCQKRTGGVSPSKTPLLAQQRVCISYSPGRKREGQNQTPSPILPSCPLTLTLPLLYFPWWEGDVGKAGCGRRGPSSTLESKGPPGLLCSTCALRVGHLRGLAMLHYEPPTLSVFEEGKSADSCSDRIILSKPRASAGR